jgi:hypothetical protein
MTESQSLYAAAADIETCQDEQAGWTAQAEDKESVASIPPACQADGRRVRARADGQDRRRRPGRLVEGRRRSSGRQSHVVLPCS